MHTEYPTTSLVHRFWASVAVTPSCWLWLGAKKPKGYGNFWVGQSGLVIAHRFAYELEVGPIPEGMQIDHLCRNKSCVNPAHMEAVTARENTRRAQPFRTVKAQCKNGHPFSPENTRMYLGTRGRVCIECDRMRSRRKRDKKHTRDHT